MCFFSLKFDFVLANSTDPDFILVFIVYQGTSGLQRIKEFNSRFFPFFNLFIHIFHCLFRTKAKRTPTEVHAVLFVVNKRKIYCKENNRNVKSNLPYSPCVTISATRSVTINFFSDSNVSHITNMTQSRLHYIEPQIQGHKVKL